MRGLQETRWEPEFVYPDVSLHVSTVLQWRLASLARLVNMLIFPWL